MKPILFNTEMVRDIQAGRKTVTRRVVKSQPWCDSPKDCGCTLWDHGKVDAACPIHCVSVPDVPYQPGDILWVRETWAHPSTAEIAAGADPNMYLYKADVMQPAAWDKWRPSIHMPKEAARLFLRVTGVRVERLQDITEDGANAEGAKMMTTPNIQGVGRTYRQGFGELWDSTIKPADLPRYGWDANPWVWVVEFERISKEAAMGGGGDDA